MSDLVVVGASDLSPDVDFGSPKLGIKRGFASTRLITGLKPSEEAAIVARVRRYEMLFFVRSLFPSNQGLWACNRLVSPKADGVELRRRVDKLQNAYASWGQLCTCGLLWKCPVCAARIAQGRASEIDRMITAWVERGNSVVFETLTMQHGAGESIKTVLGRYEAGWRYGWSGRPWQLIRRDLGIHGVATAREVTCGSHGWHAHKHRLNFIEGQHDKADLVAQVDSVMRPRWLSALRSVGGDGNEHAYSVRAADSAAAEYFAKFQHEPSRPLPWGAGHEFAASHAKSARAGRTYFQLLEDAMMGDAGALALFMDFSEGFKGLAQIYMSRGLRDELLPGESEKSDAELAAFPEGDSYLWRLLSRADWQMVYAQGLRRDLERLCVAGDHVGARELLESARALDFEEWSKRESEAVLAVIP